MKLSRKHPFLTLSYELRELLVHLKNFGITCFCYMKNYQNGQQINLATSPEWIEDYYNLNLATSSTFEYNPKHYNLDYLLWSSLTHPSHVILHGREKYGYDHGITLINQTHNGCEFYFFSGNVTQSNMQNILINNINVLHHFILFFKEKFDKELKKLEKNKNIIKRNYYIHDDLTDFQMPEPTEEQRKTFFHSTQIRQLHVCLPNLKEIRFSPQQTKCIQSLMEFKAAPDIALDLGVNQRTVESYLDEIKLKLNCHTKTELLRTLFQLIGLNEK